MTVEQGVCLVWRYLRESDRSQVYTMDIFLGDKSMFPAITWRSESKSQNQIDWSTPGGKGHIVVDDMLVFWKIQLLNMMIYYLYICSYSRLSDQRYVSSTVQVYTVQSIEVRRTVPGPISGQIKPRKSLKSLKLTKETTFILVGHVSSHMTGLCFPLLPTLVPSDKLSVLPHRSTRQGAVQSKWAVELLNGRKRWQVTFRANFHRLFGWSGGLCSRLKVGGRGVIMQGGGHSGVQVLLLLDQKIVKNLQVVLFSRHYLRQSTTKLTPPIPYHIQSLSYWDKRGSWWSWSDKNEWAMSRGFW